MFFIALILPLGHPSSFASDTSDGMGAGSCTPPSAPRLVVTPSFDDLGKPQVAVFWTPGENSGEATVFTLYRSDLGPVSLATVTEATVMAFQDLHVSQRSSYSYLVVGCNGACCQKSNQQTATLADE